MSEAAAATKQEKASVTVSRQELPLSCPNKNTPNASLHPRVYLPIEKTGEATCPYCGTHYVLD